MEHVQNVINAPTLDPQSPGGDVDVNHLPWALAVEAQEALAEEPEGTGLAAVALWVRGPWLAALGLIRLHIKNRPKQRRSWSVYLG